MEGTCRHVAQDQYVQCGSSNRFNDQLEQQKVIVHLRVIWLLLSWPCHKNLLCGELSRVHRAPTTSRQSTLMPRHTVPRKPSRHYSALFVSSALCSLSLSLVSTRLIRTHRLSLRQEQKNGIDLDEESEKSETTSFSALFAQIIIMTGANRVLRNVQ